MVRYIVPGILFTLFAYMSVFNALSIWKRTIKHQRFPSIAPFIAGFLGFFALASWPGLQMQVKARYAWIPLVLDVGCVPYLIFCVVVIGRHSWRTNRFIRLATFQSTDLCDSRVTLVLYKTGTFVLRKETTVPTWSVLGAGGTWSRERDGLSLPVYRIDVRYALDEEEGILVLRWCPENEPSILDHTDLRLTHGQLN